VRSSVAQLLADLPPDTPASTVHRFQLRWQSIRLAIGPATAIREHRDAAILVAIKDLVARLAGDPELGAQGRYPLAPEQAGDRPERSSMT
jgi:hypothetical protein